MNTKTKQILTAINWMAKWQKIVFESGNIITLKEKKDDLFIFDSEFKVANQLEYTLDQLVGVVERWAKIVQ